MISVAIIHAPWSVERVANVAELLVALPRAIVVADTERAGVMKRANRLGCWPMAERAWLAADPLATHHLVVEDDAQLCDDFFEDAEEAVLRRPDAAISFFTGARACSVATCLPRAVITPWLTWARRSADGCRFLPHHDYLLDEGLRQLSITHLRTEPSLVEHRAFPSLLRHDHVSALHFEQSPRDFTLEAR
jgi:hypothetical protein